MTSPSRQGHREKERRLEYEKIQQGGEGRDFKRVFTAGWEWPLTSRLNVVGGMSIFFEMAVSLTEGFFFFSFSV